ncbi:MAG: hypothetical protein KC443_18685, partial [Anaerolineales bacterium]|nr:hypothetical protein [Anaerolineales bacterium]
MKEKSTMFALFTVIPAKAEIHSGRIPVFAGMTSSLVGLKTVKIVSEQLLNFSKKILSILGEMLNFLEMLLNF